jgi:glycosyltransferase involved in cell wall biosynthesis
VGHFDPRKNQAALIRAARGLGLPLTLVGGLRRMHRRYHERCRRLADPGVRFLGAIDRAEVLEILSGAKLHVCSSRFETPGLANLEAAVMGCGLVLPEGPPTREYFGDDATYFSRPDGPSIREAILKGLARPVPAELSERVLREFNWRRAAEATLQGYRLALASARPEEKSRAGEA